MKATITHHKEHLIELAELLLKKEVLTSKDVDEILKKTPSAEA